MAEDRCSTLRQLGWSITAAGPEACFGLPYYRFDDSDEVIQGDFYLYTNAAQIRPIGQDVILATLVDYLPRWWLIKQPPNGAVNVRAQAAAVVAPLMTTGNQPGSRLRPLQAFVRNVAAEPALGLAMNLPGDNSGLLTSASVGCQGRSHYVQPGALLPALSGGILTFAQGLKPTGPGGPYALQGYNSLFTIARTNVVIHGSFRRAVGTANGGLPPVVPIYLVLRSPDGDLFYGDLNEHAGSGAAVPFIITCANVTEVGYYLAESETTGLSLPGAVTSLSALTVRAFSADVFYAVPGSASFAPGGARAGNTIGGGGGNGTATSTVAAQSAVATVEA